MLFSSKNSSLTQKVKETVRKLPHPETAHERRIRLIQQGFIYATLFVAGLVVAKAHTLLNLGN